MKKKILLINAVPTNNGDAALVFSLYKSLVSNGYSPHIATFRYKTIRKIYSDVPFIRDVLDYRFIHKYKLISSISIFLLFIFNRAYREADIILGVPGGYLNSYYNLYNKLNVYRISKIFRKKTIIYAQSVGPFNEKDEKWIKRYINNIDIIFVRDKLSYKNTLNINFSGKIYETVDAAFLLGRENKYYINNLSNNVAISEREWKHDNREIEKYIYLIQKIVLRLVDLDFNITFLSTCQGIDNYVDDSKMANKIVSGLPLNVRENVKIDSNFYTLDSFRERLNEFNFVVGTRLHMCILSMLNELPAFNIIYEFKSKELYRNFELEEISVDYNGDVKESIKSLNKMIEKIEHYKCLFRKQVDRVIEIAEKDFKQLLSELNE